MKRLNSCPACQSTLIIREYHCPECGTTVRGEFETDSILSLPKDKLDFLYQYLSLRGNLRELGNQLGVSYPTVRVRFDELLSALGINNDGKDEDEAIKSQVEEILEKMDKGDISSKEGIALIKKMKRSK